MGNLVFQATLGGQVNLSGPNTASTYTINVPAVAGTMVTTGDTGTVTSTMISGPLTPAVGGTGVNNGTATLTLAGNVTHAGAYARTFTATGVTSLTLPTSGTLQTTTGSLASNTGLPLTTGVTGTLPVANGGTGLTSYTANGVLYASGTGTIATGSGLQFDGSNLGLGVTPSAWSGVKALQLSNGAAVGSSSVYPATFSANAYATGSGWTANYIANGYASLYAHYNGQHQWFTAPSGTAGSAISFTQAMTLDSSGNLVIGATSADTLFNVVGGTARISGTRTAGSFLDISPNNTGSNGVTLGVSYYGSGSYGPLKFNTGGSEAARIDSSGNLLVGTTNAGAGIGWTTRFALDAGGNYGAVFKTSSSSLECIDCWNTATSGNNAFVNFYTETSPTGRGSITYNRGVGLVAYNTTSDYRAKDILGDVQDATKTTMDLKVHLGQMHGATQSRPMFIAHELSEQAPYCVTGEKDAVDENGNPIYQQVDHTPLIPLLVKTIQEQQALITTLQSQVATLTAKVGI